ncbi:S41 family peptidase [Streptosporangium sp. NPDC087985]|uniref:S41 family peptidase n=1 Tax=Streptosporangium sp. NPDC087985 TaxID=3366196 RepID=UPI00380BA4A6
MVWPNFGVDSIPLVLPAADITMSGESALLHAEKAEFEVVLGVTIDVREPGAIRGPRWELLIDTEHDGPAELSWDADTRVMTSRATDVDGLMRSLNLVHTLARSGSPQVLDLPCEDLAAAVDRTVAEVGACYPGFALRGLDWAEICRDHAQDVLIAADPFAAAQRWTARLQDAHTGIEPVMRPTPLPYVVTARDGGARFVRVPAGTPAYEAGVRPGWRLIGLDGAEGEDLAAMIVDVCSRTPSPPHAHAFLSGRRLLAVGNGQIRAMKATGPGGARAAWSEDGQHDAGEPITWRRLDAGVGYLQIAIWTDLDAVEQGCETALTDLRGCDRLLLDLRGNVGGNLMLATATRDRFLRSETRLGSIRYTDGAGGLGPVTQLKGEPSSARRWAGRLAVLTDPLTCSASEDFLLGLQGLEHVKVIGQPSAGGSGRPRHLRLLPEWTLRISTALTYDRTGHCIEGHGIPVDVPTAVDWPVPAEAGRELSDPAIRAAITI